MNIIMKYICMVLIIFGNHFSLDIADNKNQTIRKTKLFRLNKDCFVLNGKKKVCFIKRGAIVCRVDSEMENTEDFYLYFRILDESFNKLMKKKTSATGKQMGYIYDPKGECLRRLNTQFKMLISMMEWKRRGGYKKISNIYQIVPNSELVIDPYGVPIVLDTKNVCFVSAGPDRLYKTIDDIRYSYSCLMK